jgi:predicted kinase
VFVLVTGPAGSGKTTVSRPLAHRLGLPLIAKDAIKDALIDVLGAADVTRSRELGRAAVAVMKGVVAGLPAAVVDSVWIEREAAIEWAQTLPGRVIEVFCRCDLGVLEQRYRERVQSRGAGNFDLERTQEELWAERYLQPLNGNWSVIEVDTTQPLDLDRLVVAVINH